MANKILLKHKGDVDDFYEPSDSENEYTEHEKKLLKKVRKGPQHDVDEQNTILAFDDNGDDSDDDDEYKSAEDFDDKYEADSDIDNGNDDDVPDARAWGSKRRDFHSTDFVDQDYSSYTQQELELAEQEENEALAIQKRLAKQLNETDFTLDAFNVDDTSKSKAKKHKSREIHMQKDLSQLSQREKEQLFKKESPEFAGLTKDFRERLTESLEILEPSLAYFRNNCLDHSFVDFVSIYNQLIHNYCINVSYYLILKAKRVPVQHHPIVKRLINIRQLLLQVDEKYSIYIQPQLNELVKAVKDHHEFQMCIHAPNELPFAQSIINRHNVSSDSSENEDVDFRKKLQLMANQDSETDNERESADDDEEDERRQITYQIAKNKGLTPYRKKELRNPRVKHRNKFRKALIRRKGAVRTVRKEIHRYDGEKFGIKAGVKKGIKIK